MSISDKVQYPTTGCLVEFFHGNTPTLAIVLEEQSGRLRLYTHNRREIKLAANRLLPWLGPQYPASLTKEQMIEQLEMHRVKREELASTINILEVWELTEGEVEKASAGWFAGLFNDSLSVDDVAAMGRSLISAKTHFRFSPPDFEIFSKETVEKRLAEAEIEKERERISSSGVTFFQALWEKFTHNDKPFPPLPEESIAQKLHHLLLTYISDPESQEEEILWRQLTKGLPSDPHLPLFLAQTWGIVPDHYNYLLDRVGYDRGEAWSDAFACDKQEFMSHLTKKLEEIEASGGLAEEAAQKDALSLPFVSIDPSTTKDRDDAFYVEQKEDGSYRLAVAIACPALCWPFGTPLDKAVQKRTSSLYLPEGDEHMLSKDIGFAVFSLDVGSKRPAMVLDMAIDTQGLCTSSHLLVGSISMAANLSLDECEPFFAEEETQDKTSPLNAHAPMLTQAKRLAELLQKARLAAGAVIIERPDPIVKIQQENGETIVEIDNSLCADTTHLVVGELMVFANSTFAAWGASREIPLLYRTQDVGLPKEFCGVWKAPEDIAKVVRSLPPATLEMQPKRHAGLGVSAYINVTSPIRRYADILNQAQLIHWLEYKKPMISEEGLASLLPLLQARMEAVSQVQRFRPRYWKLVYFRQQGEKVWWQGTVTEVNDAFVTVSLPWAQLFVRGRRKFFDEKVFPGQEIEIRLGKIKPLQNEIMLLEAREY